MPARGPSRIPTRATLKEVYGWCDILDGTASPVGDWGTPLFTGSARDFAGASFLRGSSEYYASARRGTVSDLARVYWVKVLKYSEATGRALIRTLTEDELPIARMVDSVDGMWIEADVLYPLIRGRDLGRYCAKTEGWYQIVPNKHYDHMPAEEEFAIQYPLAYSYFRLYGDRLRQRSTYRRYQSHLPFYAMYCVGKYSFERFKVVWMEQQNAKNFRCAVVSDTPDVTVPNSVVVPDHKLYFLPCRSEREAHYVCGFLNSAPVRKWLGGFLLHKQIGTTIFEHMNVPMYNGRSATCRAIAKISRDAHRNRGVSRDRTYLRDDVEQALAGYVRAMCTEKGERGQK